MVRRHRRRRVRHLAAPALRRRRGRRRRARACPAGYSAGLEIGRAAVARRHGRPTTARPSTSCAPDGRRAVLYASEHDADLAGPVRRRGARGARALRARRQPPPRAARGAHRRDGDGGRGSAGTARASGCRAVGFSPVAGDRRLLAVHERRRAAAALRRRPATPATEVHPDLTDLPGDLDADWYADGARAARAPRGAGPLDAAPGRAGRRGTTDLPDAGRHGRRRHRPAGRRRSSSPGRRRPRRPVDPLAPTGACRARAARRAGAAVRPGAGRLRRRPRRARCTPWSPRPPGDGPVPDGLPACTAARPGTTATPSPPTGRPTSTSAARSCTSTTAAPPATAPPGATRSPAGPGSPSSRTSPRCTTGRVAERAGRPGAHRARRRLLGRLPDPARPRHAARALGLRRGRGAGRRLPGRLRGRDGADAGLRPLAVRRVAGRGAASATSAPRRSPTSTRCASRCWCSPGANDPRCPIRQIDNWLAAGAGARQGRRGLPLRRRARLAGRRRAGAADAHRAGRSSPGSSGCRPGLSRRQAVGVPPAPASGRLVDRQRRHDASPGRRSASPSPAPRRAPRSRPAPAAGGSGLDAAARSAPAAGSASASARVGGGVGDGVGDGVGGSSVGSCVGVGGRGRLDLERGDAVAARRARRRARASASASVSSPLPTCSRRVESRSSTAVAHGVRVLVVGRGEDGADLARGPRPPGSPAQPVSSSSASGRASSRGAPHERDLEPLGGVAQALQVGPQLVGQLLADLGQLDDAAPRASLRSVRAGGDDRDEQQQRQRRTARRCGGAPAPRRRRQRAGGDRLGGVGLRRPACAAARSCARRRARRPGRSSPRRRRATCVEVGRRLRRRSGGRRARGRSWPAAARASRRAASSGTCGARCSRASATSTVLPAYSRCPVRHSSSTSPRA